MYNAAHIIIVRTLFKVSIPCEKPCKQITIAYNKQGAMSCIGKVMMRIMMLDVNGFSLFLFIEFLH